MRIACAECPALPNIGCPASSEPACDSCVSRMPWRRLHNESCVGSVIGLCSGSSFRRQVSLPRTGAWPPARWAARLSAFPIARSRTTKAATGSRSGSAVHPSLPRNETSSRHRAAPTASARGAAWCTWGFVPAAEARCRRPRPPRAWRSDSPMPRYCRWALRTNGCSNRPPTSRSRSNRLPAS